MVFNVVPLSAFKFLFSKSKPVAPLTSIVIEPAEPNPSFGIYTFGISVSGERFIEPTQFIHVEPNQWGNRIREHRAIIKSPHGEKISLVELHSFLKAQSAGEGINEESRGEDGTSVTIRFRSKEGQGINFFVHLFGPR